MEIQSEGKQVTKERAVWKSCLGWEGLDPCQSPGSQRTLKESSRQPGTELIPIMNSCSYHLLSFWNEPALCMHSHLILILVTGEYRARQGRDSPKLSSLSKQKFPLGRNYKLKLA